MKVMNFAAQVAAVAGVCALAGCGAPVVSELEAENPSIAQIDVRSDEVSSLTLGDDEIVATFDVASAVLDRQVDRVNATWDAYAEGGRTRLEVEADGSGVWIPFVVEFEELVVETGLTLSVGHADVPAGTTSLATRLVLERESAKGLSPVVTNLALEAFTLAELWEEGDAPEAAEDEDVIEGTLAHAPDLVTRSEWGAKSPRCSGSSHDPFKMTFHHTVTPNGEKGSSARARMRQIQASHFARGFCDVGYHFVVDADGKIYRGRVTAARTGAHVENQNTGNVGVALMGTFVSSPLRDRQMNGLIRALAWQGDKWNVPLDGSHIKGHGQWSGTATACPGQKTLNRKPEIITGIRQHVNQTH